MSRSLGAEHAQFHAHGKKATSKKKETHMFSNIVFEIIAQASNIAGPSAASSRPSASGKCSPPSVALAEHVEVQLRLEGEDSTVALPLEMLRKDISRAEPSDVSVWPLKNQGQRFSRLKAMSTPAFMRSVNEVVEGKTSTLVIPCTKEELDQFATA